MKLAVSVSRGFSLTEILVVIAIIGITSMLAIPMLTDFVANGNRTIAKKNAQHTVSISGKLSAVGVAHVLPESLGGAEATSRLLRRGITVPDGPLEGEYFTIGEISDENIQSAAIYMDIMFETEVLQLAYNPNAN